MTIATQTTSLHALQARCAGRVFGPDDHGWDDARQAWNLAVDQRPVGVVYAADEDDVAQAIAFARAQGLQVAPQGTGHNAGPLGDLSGTLLLRTSGMTGVEIDPVRRRARVRAGALWQDVAGPAGEHGLAPLSGSSPDVGVVGFSLGGGIGWLGRRYGLQTNSILAVELVTAEGELVRADRDHDPELFWALRGGGGNFGAVTAMEFALYPVAEVVAGAMMWPWERSREVLGRWRDWSATAPDEVTTSFRIMQFPPLPEIPEPLRGRQLVVIDGAHCGDPADAEAVLAPLRELDPEIDMFGSMPAAGLIRVHGDPEEPVPYESGHAMLGALPDEALDAFVAAAGPASGSSLLMAELRQLGGALGRTPAEHGALPRLEADFGLFGVGMAMDEAMRAASLADAQRLTSAMEPWANDTTYLNFAEHAIDTRKAYEAEAYRRLQAVRSRIDPAGLFRANHAIDGTV